MFIPIILTLDPSTELSWMWVFHKMASIGKGYRWGIVAQKEYFENYESFPMHHVVEELYDVGANTEAVLENIIPISIPENIIERFIERFPSQTDAYVNSFTEDWDELIDYLYEEINKLIIEDGTSIDGLILFKYYRCFERLADRLHVPTFYFEFGAFRQPDYRDTFYWSQKGILGNAKLDERLVAFQKEIKNTQVILLEPEEILAIFLNEDKLDYLQKPKFKQYEFGILGGYSVPTPGSAFNGITFAEEVSRVRKVCPDNKIIIKCHPGDPLGAMPRFPNVESPGITSAQFFQKCKRIVCAGSNATFESALYGVPSYDLGWSQYSFISNSSLKELEDTLPDKIALNFIAFGCLAPFELLKDIDYVKFLLDSKSEVEIYKYNLEYYLSSYGLTYEQLLESENRLELILKSRFQNADAYLRVIPKGRLTPLAELQIELKATKKKLKDVLIKEAVQVQSDEHLHNKLQHLREENDGLKNLEKENENLKVQIEELRVVMIENMNLKAQIEKIDEVMIENSDLKMHLASVEKTCQELDLLYHQIIESTSFKCMKPLRLMADWLKSTN